MHICKSTPKFIGADINVLIHYSLYLLKGSLFVIKCMYMFVCCQCFMEF